VNHPDDFFLDEIALRRLCGGRKKKDAQIRALEKLGYHWIPAADGRPLVLRADVERKTRGRASSPEPRLEPDFSVFPAVR
jgi:hypothetical protein